MRGRNSLRSRPHHGGGGVLSRGLGRVHWAWPGLLGLLIVLGYAQPQIAKAEGFRFLDEIRLGAAYHNIEPSDYETGVDVTAEILTSALPGSYDNPLLDYYLRPRFHLGGSFNSAGDTNKVYFGLTWTAELGEAFFFESSFGGAWHDGPLTVPGDPKLGYGCRVNFRESVSLGYKVSQQWRMLLTLEHMSNANLCSVNRGLTSAGVRFGYRLP